MIAPPFNKFLGTQVSSHDAGTAEVRLELEPHHLNLRGVPHGGVITAILDTALGAAVVSAIPAEWWCATTSLTVQFIGGAREGTLTSHGRVLRRGRRVAFAEGEIKDSQGRLIATASGSWHLWPQKPGDRAAAREAESGPWVRLRGAEGTIPVGKILAVGRNYAEHNLEMGKRADDLPLLFLKPATALLHDGGTLYLPTECGQVHHEVELVVAIGVPGRRIQQRDAPKHVLGYAVGLDMTLRDLQSTAKKKGEPWSLSKGFDGAAPISELVSAADVGDVSNLDIRLRVNGETRQHGNTSQMTRPVAALVAEASRLITLERGDLIYTGTPAGVGPVHPGDRLEATIDRVGTLSIDVAAEPSR